MMNPIEVMAFVCTMLFLAFSFYSLRWWMSDAQRWMRRQRKWKELEKEGRWRKFKS